MKRVTYKMLKNLIQGTFKNFAATALVSQKNLASITGPLYDF